MIVDNIKNVIDIIESKQFDNTFYKQFILEELNQQPGKMSGMMKGGLAIGGGLLAAAALNSNPELKQQLANTVKSLGSNVSSAAKSLGTGVSGAAKTVADKIHHVGQQASQTANDKIDEYKVTHPVLNDSINEKDLNERVTKAEAGASNPSLTPAQQKEYANAHHDMLAFQKKQEAAGVFKNGYSKTHSDHAWDSIRSDAEKVSNTKELEGSIAAAGQRYGQIKSDVLNKIQNVKTGYGQLKNIISSEK
jgi:hypothetical protein